MCDNLHFLFSSGAMKLIYINPSPHPGAKKQIKTEQKATLRSQCFANRALSAIIRT